MNRTTGKQHLAEAELVALAQRGDAAAFEELVLRCQDRVHNACYRLCGNEAEAADLTQSTFLKAYRALGRFELRAGFFTWVFRIAVNLALSQRRQTRRRPRLVADDSDGQTRLEPASDREQDDPRGRALQRERHERLAAALQRLDEEFRAAVILKDIENLDYAAIAEILQTPIGTVKSRIHRGRLALRAMLADLDEDRGCA